MAAQGGLCPPSAVPARANTAVELFEGREDPFQSACPCAAVENRNWTVLRNA